MPWYFYLALKQLFPTGRWFPFFTAISVMGVALGVMVLVIVTSVMGGFGHSRLREAVFGGVTRELLDGAGVPLVIGH